jgi:hypothetical protein
VYLGHEQKIETVIVSNSTNINKTHKHLSPDSIVHKQMTLIRGIGNPDLLTIVLSIFLTNSQLTTDLTIVLSIFLTNSQLTTDLTIVLSIFLTNSQLTTDLTIVN